MSVDITRAPIWGPLPPPREPTVCH